MWIRRRTRSDVKQQILRDRQFLQAISLHYAQSAEKPKSTDREPPDRQH